ASLQLCWSDVTNDSDVWGVDHDRFFLSNVRKASSFPCFSQVLAQRRIHPVSAKYRRHFGHDHERRKSGKKPGDVFLTVFVFLLHHPIVLQRPTVKVGHETSPRVRGGNKVTSPVKQVGNRFFHHHSGIPCSRTFPSNTGIAGQNSPDGQLLV